MSKAVLLFVLVCLIGYPLTSSLPTPIGAEVNTHYAHASSENSWIQGSASFARAGANAYAGKKGVGAMAKATLGEVSGKLGPGPLSVGGTLGLSADTGLTLGPDFNLKVLGTGASISGRKGIEVCYFGTCISFG